MKTFRYSLIATGRIPKAGKTESSVQTGADSIMVADNE